MNALRNLNIDNIPARADGSIDLLSVLLNKVSKIEFSYVPNIKFDMKAASEKADGETPGSKRYSPIQGL